MQQQYHIPVLYTEAIAALNIKPGGMYVDCTFGGGGHTKGILDKLDKSGRVVAFDQDADAQRNLPGDERIIFVPQNFRHLSRFLKLHKIEKVDGVLADLGVSSWQFDEGARGFSTRFDGLIDMRMDRRQPLTAADVLKTYSEERLHKMFERYGEVTNAKTLAKHIVQGRQVKPLQTIENLRVLLQPVVKGNPHKYLAQVFQALRIEVNDELGALREMLTQLPAVLNSGGRAVIITFHSLEDREVKNFFRNGSFEEEVENPFSTEEKEMLLKVITKKPVTPSAEEIKRNPRSRSSKLRVAERV